VPCISEPESCAVVLCEFIEPGFTQQPTKHTFEKRQSASGYAQRPEASVCLIVKREAFPKRVPVYQQRNC
jgi:hypothetical protein